MGLGLTAVVCVELAVVVLFPADPSILVLVFSLFAPLFTGVLFLYLHFYYRRIVPREFAFTPEGLLLRFSPDEERLLEWERIDRIDLLAPGPPSTFVMALIHRTDGKLERAEIHGEPARMLKNHFERSART